MLAPVAVSYSSRDLWAAVSLQPGERHLRLTQPTVDVLPPYRVPLIRDPPATVLPQLFQWLPVLHHEPRVPYRSVSPAPHLSSSGTRGPSGTRAATEGPPPAPSLGPPSADRALRAAGVPARLAPPPGQTVIAAGSGWTWSETARPPVRGWGHGRFD